MMFPTGIRGTGGRPVMLAKCYYCKGTHDKREDYQACAKAHDFKND